MRFATDIRGAGNRAELAGVVDAHLGAVLHVPRVAMLLQGPSTDSFVSADGGVADLPVRSALGDLMAVAARPLTVGPEEPGSWFALLPPGEQDWVCEAGASVLVPLVGPQARPCTSRPKRPAATTRTATALRELLQALTRDHDPRT